MSRNDEIATVLEEFADLLEAKGVEYKPTAYRRAAENVREHPAPVEGLAGEGADALKEIDRVGEAIASKIVEYVRTGSIEELDELREELPVDMTALTRVEGVGPKTVGTLYSELDIKTLDELEGAAEAGEIREIKGFGTKTEKNILENVPFARNAQKRDRLGDARPVADAALSYLADLGSVSKLEVCGSIRRWRDTIGDVDVLVASDERKAVVESFTDWPEADATIEAGANKASVRANGLRVDLRVVVIEEFGSALQYFTGSQEHNIAVRNRAIDQGLKVNEYGVFDVSDLDGPTVGQRVGDRIAGETEAGVYDALGMAWVPPELRENAGEVSAAADHGLPDLLEEGDVRGDIHTHSDWSDSNYTIAEMVEAATERGYDYHAVTDHATGPGIVGSVGLDEDDLTAQAEAVAAVREEATIDVLHGVEANIDADGGLSTDGDALADLDIVIASPHAALGNDEGATERLVQAIEHPEVDVLGHPTGRIINGRAGLRVDFDRIGKAAAREGVAIEVNANPARLDANGEAVRAIIDAGATIAIATDAHSPREFEYVRYGVHTARRGWAERADVINTRSSEELRTFLET
ncbi:DNA polymerase/3'-5' exonuclease PolX [Halopenitus sp. H-Gu1]|uniref:DNA polymerase/3'-5' exonuclease PolX n=1 Tax=Halopenitus sp. H-Gu1 TaxID=3242697 RepID=UPI00359ECF0A